MPGCGTRELGLSSFSTPSRQPHLGQRLAAGAGHLLHGRGGLLRGLASGEHRPVGERDHHRQVVGDDVVHLPRDPGALGGGRDTALLVALELEPRGPFLQRCQQRPPVLDADAEQGRRDHQRREADEEREHRVAPAQRRQHRPDLGHAHRRRRPPARRDRRNGVQRDQQRQIRAQLDIDQPLHQQHQRDRPRTPLAGSGAAAPAAGIAPPSARYPTAGGGAGWERRSARRRRRSRCRSGSGGSDRSAAASRSPLAPGRRLRMRCEPWPRHPS